MDGMLAMAEAQRLNNNLDPMVAAACIAFGFVFIHAFMDGNGRIHRYRIHDVLAKAGFTPERIVLPVSAVILANLTQYTDYSRLSFASSRFSQYSASLMPSACGLNTGSTPSAFCAS